jgi:hypothetical protein
MLCPTYPLSFIIWAIFSKKYKLWSSSATFSSPSPSHYLLLVVQTISYTPCSHILSICVLPIMSETTSLLYKMIGNIRYLYIWLAGFNAMLCQLIHLFFYTQLAGIFVIHFLFGHHLGELSNIQHSIWTPLGWIIQCTSVGVGALTFFQLVCWKPLHLCDHSEIWKKCRELCGQLLPSPISHHEQKVRPLTLFSFHRKLYYEFFINIGWVRTTSGKKSTPQS